MTVFDLARLTAAAILTLRQARTRALLRDGHRHACRVVEAVNEPWLYRGATD